MANLHLKISSAWKPIDSAYVKISGAWKTVKKIHVKISGAWKVAWTNWVVTLSGGGHTSFGNPPPTVGVQFRSDGKVYTNAGSQIAASTDWVIPNTAVSEASFVIRFTQISSDPNWSYSGGIGTPDGSTWYALTSIRTVSGKSTNLSDANAVFKAEISADGGATILDDGLYSLNSNFLI